MKQGYPPVRLSLILLAVALIWRMIGAPLTLAQWRALEVPVWQARVLLPGRVERILLLWLEPRQDEQTQNTLRQLENGAELALLDAPVREPVTLSVWNAQKGQLEQMELESYVYGVVAAEMPAAYHAQALMAQSVAARTRALYQKANGGCSLCTGADVCTESGHCQGYADTIACMEKWGDEYLVYQQRIMDAVAATAGQVVTWEGEPIQVMYHAISGGQTEDVQAVFFQAVPYLVSVKSTGEEGVRGYREDTFFSFSEASQLLSKAFPDLGITPETLQRTLLIASHTETGRVKEVLLGEGEVKGTDFRGALGLRSTLFTFTMDADGITFHQTGYGHGVGMSQAGANSMAADGYGYEKILAHYYPGTALEKR